MIERIIVLLCSGGSGGVLCWDLWGSFLQSVFSRPGQALLLFYDVGLPSVVFVSRRHRRIHYHKPNAFSLALHLVDEPQVQHDTAVHHRDSLGGYGSPAEGS